MHYLQMFFQDRDDPVLVPITEKVGNAILNQFRDRTDALGFHDFGSSLEHDVWFNTRRLQMLRLLLEMEELPFDPKTIRASRQFPESEDEEVDLADVRWRVTFWIRRRKDPVTISDLSGHDWVEIYTSCDSDEQFLIVTDEDGEELALRVADVEMVVGLELDRYSVQQLEAIAKFVQFDST